VYTSPVFRGPCATSSSFSGTMLLPLSPNIASVRPLPLNPNVLFLVGTIISQRFTERRRRPRSCHLYQCAGSLNPWPVCTKSSQAGVEFPHPPLKEVPLPMIPESPAAIDTESVDPALHHEIKCRAYTLRNGMAIPSMAAIHMMSYSPNCLGWPTRQPNFRSIIRAK
jgi:hypothetical protein